MGLGPGAELFLLLLGNSIGRLLSQFARDVSPLVALEQLGLVKVIKAPRAKVLEGVAAVNVFSEHIISNNAHKKRTSQNSLDTMHILPPRPAASLGLLVLGRIVLAKRARKRLLVCLLGVHLLLLRLVSARRTRTTLLDIVLLPASLHSPPGSRHRRAGSGGGRRRN